MTLDEAIMKLDLIASDAFEGGDANEFRQLAEWLRELIKLRNFTHFIARNVMEDDFEENGRFYAEMFCRRLNKLGVIRSENNKWTYDEEVNADGNSD